MLRRAAIDASGHADNVQHVAINAARSYIAAGKRKEIITKEEMIKMLRAEDVEAWNAWRYKDWYTVVDLPHIDLAGLNLEGINFYRAYLTRANLEGCNLKGSHLYMAVLPWANLEGADLTGSKPLMVDMTGASLAGASLDYTKLHGAQLSITDLNNASLRWSSLHSADLSWAVLSRTNFYGSDMNGVTITAIANDTILAGIKFDWHDRPLVAALLERWADRGSNDRQKFELSLSVSVGSGPIDWADLLSSRSHSQKTKLQAIRYLKRHQMYDNPMPSTVLDYLQKQEKRR